MSIQAVVPVSTTSSSAGAVSASRGAASSEVVSSTVVSSAGAASPWAQSPLLANTTIIIARKEKKHAWRRRLGRVDARGKGKDCFRFGFGCFICPCLLKSFFKYQLK